MFVLFNIVAATINASLPTARQFGRSGKVEMGQLRRRRMLHRSLQIIVTSESTASQMLLQSAEQLVVR